MIFIRRNDFHRETNQLYSEYIHTHTPTAHPLKSLISSILLNNANTSSSGICSVSMLSTTGVSYPYSNMCCYGYIYCYSNMYYATTEQVCYGNAEHKIKWKKCLDIVSVEN